MKAFCVAFCCFVTNGIYFISWEFKTYDLWRNGDLHKLWPLIYQHISFHFISIHKIIFLLFSKNIFFFFSNFLLFLNFFLFSFYLQKIFCWHFSLGFSFEFIFKIHTFTVIFHLNFHHPLLVAAGPIITQCLVRAKRNVTKTGKKICARYVYLFLLFCFLCFRLYILLHFPTFKLSYPGFLCLHVFFLVVFVVPPNGFLYYCHYHYQISSVAAASASHHQLLATISNFFSFFLLFRFLSQPNFSKKKPSIKITEIPNSVNRELTVCFQFYFVSHTHNS